MPKQSIDSQIQVFPRFGTGCMVYSSVYFILGKCARLCTRAVHTLGYTVQPAPEEALEYVAFDYESGSV
jgi:hypothetical protein